MSIARSQRRAPDEDQDAHQPWSAAPLELKGAGVELGNTYPKPIIDHKKGRERALKAYTKVRAA
jgi:deoxyribodipyrimidine photo-lyase